MKVREEKWIELLKWAEIIREDPENKRPLDRTECDPSQPMISLMSKGQKFVPMPNRVDLTKKYNDFLRFCRIVRLGIFFKDQQDNRPGSEIEPWLRSSSFQPEQGINEAVEKFLAELYCKLFDPKNCRKVKQNLSREEKVALRILSTWKKDADCPRAIRVQDKGSKFVIDWKNKYIQNISNYIGDGSIFRQ